MNRPDFQTCRVEMSDGVRLATHVHVPEGEGPWPVIFSRSPYPGMLPFWHEQAKFWTGHGYAFVIQECRGTGASEGQWVPFAHEEQDGLDSLGWIVRQPWMNGKMATYGSSYCGVVQWCMADRLPPEVKTVFIGFTGIERYRQNYMNGMFRHDIYTSWAIGNSGVPEAARRPGLYREALAVRPHVEMDVRLFGRELPWYRDWVTEVSPDSPYWASGFWAELKEKPRRTRVPVMMTAGWFDHNLEASLLSFDKLPEEVRARSALIVGPWVHTESVSGDLDYPGHDCYGPRQRDAALAWFDHHLKGEEMRLPAGIRTYIIRENRWLEWRDGIRADRVLTYHLRPQPAGAEARMLSPEKEDGPAAATYRYDPDNPVPTRGGAAVMHYLSGDPEAVRPASVIQPPPGARDDVLSFLSGPLEEDLRIAGRIRARLFVSSDAEDTAFTIQVMEVFPDGTAVNIRDGITSLAFRNGASSPLGYTPGEVVEAVIDMWPITWTVKRGSRLRVDVSSSNFPAYHVHPNIAGTWSRIAGTRIAEQTVHLGGEHGSRIEIPVATG
ncbi:putative hydrolase, CocE/NonD family [Thermobacillus composti KWC4]|uniref:Putative hydrolase, CocE/NonD family n=1 Tax=Thermobacillus composti (strain DSM 18247 / JCM 13945 / KWC4) TaxID=717605 RepID=L0EA33_THECK|nr:CocE/NonD family hydrolase [Thermobacillus composti]AGA56642.1 putative hydrolase, CocE/NonD family [Thermobacillus composti KWC4]